MPNIGVIEGIRPAVASGSFLSYCTVREIVAACATSPICVAVTVIWDVPSGVAGATVTRADPGADATDEVAIIVTVAGLGMDAGAV